MTDPAYIPGVWSHGTKFSVCQAAGCTQRAKFRVQAPIRRQNQHADNGGQLAFCARHRGEYNTLGLPARERYATQPPERRLP